MPYCSLKPVWVEDAGETVQHIYILYESANAEQERVRVHDWMKEYFPDHEELAFGKHYITRQAEDFAFIFKLTWS